MASTVPSNHLQQLLPCLKTHHEAVFAEEGQRRLGHPGAPVACSPMRRWPQGHDGERRDPGLLAEHRQRREHRDPAEPSPRVRPAKWRSVKPIIYAESIGDPACYDGGKR